MKGRWRLLVGILGLTIIGIVLFFRLGDKAKLAADQTRRALRQQGFKLEMEEFHLTTSSELRARAAALTAAGITLNGLPGSPSASLSWQATLDRLKPIGTNSALVIWKEVKWGTRFTEDLWPELRAGLS